MCPPIPGPTEQVCYILQGQLTEDEKRRWNVNATPDVSDDAIRAKEDAAAATLSGHKCHLISTEARDPWFAPRLQHLRTFPRLSPRPTRRPRFADPRCGCLRHSESRWRGAHAPRPRGLSGPGFPAPGHADTCGAGGQGSMPPRPSGPPVAATTPLRRITTAPMTPTLPRTLQTLLRAQACFGCDVHGQLVTNQSHWGCKLLSAGTSSFSRGTGSAVLVATGRLREPSSG